MIALDVVFDLPEKGRRTRLTPTAANVAQDLDQFSASRFDAQLPVRWSLVVFMRKACRVSGQRVLLISCALLRLEFVQ